MQEVEVGRSEKMSKSKKNIVDPMSITNTYGADTARLFMMSDSPPERDLDWSISGVDGCFRYLKKIWVHLHSYSFDDENLDIIKEANGQENNIRGEIHLCIKNTTESIDNFRYNSAVASIRKLSNILLVYKSNSNKKIREQIILEGWKSFLIMMSPITPHITAELWPLIDKNSALIDQSWPNINKNLLENKKLVIAIQINGKLKNTLEIDQDDAKDKEIQKEKALALPNIKNAISNNLPKKIIVIPGKVINIVI